MLSVHPPNPNAKEQAGAPDHKKLKKTSRPIFTQSWISQCLLAFYLTEIIVVLREYKIVISYKKISHSTPKCTKSNQ
ncbi:MAG: hypothetical protein VW987_13170, partial [Alphaproteobacteria bacterium]